MPNKIPRTSQPTSFRLTPEAVSILLQLKEKLGFSSRDDVVELALRELGQKWLEQPQLMSGQTTSNMDNH
jgi:Arc/MetJ-type ribon-helix-helix transcriptional regulator